MGFNVQAWEPGSGQLRQEEKKPTERYDPFLPMAVVILIGGRTAVPYIRNFQICQRSGGLLSVLF